MGPRLRSMELSTKPNMCFWTFRKMGEVLMSPKSLKAMAVSRCWAFCLVMVQTRYMRPASKNKKTLENGFIIN